MTQVALRPGRKVSGSSVTEWDEPCDGPGTTNTVTSMMVHDPGGQIWIKMTVGEQYVYIRPENMEDFAANLERTVRSWANCHWDLELDSCISRTCRHRPGGTHIGRLAPWEALRTRRVTGPGRDREIQRLEAAGVPRMSIAIRVGWSRSTVSKVICDARRSQCSEVAVR